MQNTRWKIHSGFEELKPLLFDIQAHFSESDSFIHDARNKLKTIKHNGLDIVVKSFKVPNFLNQFAYAYLRDSKAKKSYVNALKLEKLHITTPQPIGYIEFHNSGLLKESYFLSLQSHYDFTIREVLLNREWPDHDSIFKQFGEFTYDIHEKGVLHKDYSPGNILITALESGKYRFDLVDINRMRFGPLSHDEKMKNLSRLWADESDMRLIATAYAQKMGCDVEKTVKEMVHYDLQNKKIKLFKRRLKGQK